MRGYLMPWKSDAQRRWGNSRSGKKALGKKAVAEFNRKSKGKRLPEKKITDRMA
jgi:hypothetical protein